MNPSNRLAYATTKTGNLLTVVKEEELIKITCSIIIQADRELCISKSGNQIGIIFK